ncbi:unnamed protein product [Nyctereutes procyonoides]|uniref:(raccoon dog) hypothetical protein n=1 Tax=Nyctereutes procyonoides TaxID=34880 RepID=A0A811ZKV6_NYCPR|nr:unnamed protein product [Nyctereutes procyonoides]
MRSLRWVLIQYDWCPYKKGKSGCRHAHREEHTQGEGGHPEAKERGLRRNQPANTLLSAFQLPEL